MEKTKILVCCHKKDVMATSEPYLPIHCGKALSQLDLGIIGDDTGDNISRKNPNYCELTAMYWAWKNLKDVDIIGLCHYRRYFDFHKQCRRVVHSVNFPSEDFEKIDLSVPQKIIDKIRKGYVVVRKPRCLTYNLVMDFATIHYYHDYKIVGSVIGEKHPDTLPAFNHVMWQRNYNHSHNMFIMRWQDFDEYCTWLFSVLEDVEKCTDISHYDAYQARLFGYLGEYLLDVWLYATKRKTVERPIIFISDDPEEGIDRSALNYLQRRFRGWLATQISCPRKF